MAVALSNYKPSQEIAGIYQSTENSVCFDHLLDICRTEVSTNAEALAKYANFLKNVVDNFNSSEVDFSEPTSALEIISKCLKFIYDNFSLQINVANENNSNTLVLEILFLMSIIKLKLIKGLPFENETVKFELKQIIATVLVKAVTIWIKNCDYPKANVYINIGISHLAEFGERNCNNSSLPKQRRLLLGSTTIVLFMYQAEVLSRERKVNESFEVISDLKDQIFDFPKYQNYYASLCYNISLLCYKDKKYDKSIALLRISFDVGKRGHLNSEQLRSVLKLLAESYLNWNSHHNWQKAVHALELAYTESVDSYYLLKKLEAFLIGNQDTCIKNVLNKAISWDNLDQHMVYKIINMLLNNKKETIAVEFIQEVKSSMPSSLSHIARLFAIEFKMLFKFENLTTARLAAEQILSMLSKEKNCNLLNDINLVCDVLLHRAASKQASKAYEESLTWYQYCFKIYKVINGNKENDCQILSFIQRQMCLCWIELNCINQAKEALSQMKLLNDNSLMASYLSLKIAILTTDEELATEALASIDAESHRKENTKITEEDRLFEDIDPVSILLDCSQMALNIGRKSFIIKLLETLISNSSVNCNKYLFTKCFQCLIRLHLENIEHDSGIYEKVLIYMDRIRLFLETMQQEYSRGDDENEINEMSNWFAKVCWNLAVQDNVSPGLMFELFLQCCFLFAIPACPDAANLIRQKTSLLLAAASGLHAAHFEDDVNRKNDILNKVLSVIGKCKKLSHHTIEGTNASKCPVRLLLLYEFEARAKQKSPMLENVFEEALTLPDMDAKSFELLAALSNESGPWNCRITVRALKVAINKHFENAEPDYLQISRDYHSLVQVMFHAYGLSVPLASKEIHNYCKEILEVIQKRAGGQYPEIEVLWLMVKCWNFGIYNLANEDKKLAYIWCTLAKEILKELNSLKSMYAEKLIKMYTSFFENSAVTTSEE